MKHEKLQNNCVLHMYSLKSNSVNDTYFENELLENPIFCQQIEKYQFYVFAENNHIYTKK